MRTPKRIRITIECSLAHRTAFYVKRDFEHLSSTELFQRWVEEHCAAELEQARQHAARRQDEPRPGRRRRPDGQ